MKEWAAILQNLLVQLSLRRCCHKFRQAAALQIDAKGRSKDLTGGMGEAIIEAGGTGVHFPQNLTL